MHSEFKETETLVQTVLLGNRHELWKVG